MRTNEHYQLIEILTAPNKRFLARQNALDYLKTVTIEEPQENAPEATTAPSSRTGAQNRAMHVGFELIATTLNDAGLDIRAVLKQEIEIPWTKDTVKEYLWKPVMKLAVGKQSTRELDKVGEIERVWDVVMRHLSQNHHIEYIPFPNNQSVGLAQMENLTNDNYPEYQGEPTI